MVRLRRLTALPIARRPSGSFRITGLALCIGLLTGLMVVVIKRIVAWLQIASLGYAVEHTSAPTGLLAFPRFAASLCVGAAGVTLATVILLRFGKKPAKEDTPIDAVEANALRGGLMDAHDGVSVVVPILASVGFGASVGIEAAVTQIGAVLGSLLGQRRSLPRSDIRLLVGAGAAAAIGTAYSAPIAGMLYAFELVLGSYSTRMLAPVGLAAIGGSLIAGAVSGGVTTFDMPAVGGVRWPDYPLAVLIGCAAAGIGVVTMLLVSSGERLFKKLFRSALLRLVAGALCLSVLASMFPYVLGSGHAGISATANGQVVGVVAFGLLIGKLLASAVSLGAGFRGGLFSASLLIGALLGQIIAALATVAATLLPSLPHVQADMCAAIGMASVGASIVGSPLAMIFLVVEGNHSPDAIVIVAVGAVTASFMTNRLFGYSFATWRFQQRGLALESGIDISRLSAITVAGLVRPPKRSVYADADFRGVIQAVSVAGGKGTAVYDQNGSFLGLIDPGLVELIDPEEVLPIVAADLVYATAPIVTAETSLADILEILRGDDRATLAVVDATNNRELVGCVRARDAYAAASIRLDAQRKEDLGVG